MSEGKAPARILVVGHDGYRAGAQIELLRILAWLKDHHPARMTLLLKKGGELVDDYRAVVPTHVAPTRPTREPVQLLFMFFARSLGYPRRLGQDLVKRLDVADTDLIYANSVASIDLALELKAVLNCPMVCHVHELELSIHRYCGVERFREARSHINGYIAASKAVEENLFLTHEIASDQVHRIYPGVLIPGPDEVDRLKAAVPLTKRALGIPDDAFVVGGCGTTDWRKAPDVFLQIAHAVGRKGTPRPVHFVWVGGTSDWELDNLLYDMRKLGIGSFVHFLGPQQHPEQYFALFDAFLLTSREDPFPLVCLEAATLGTPIICFEGAGGMPEFVGDDAGFVVPYLDVQAASDRVLSLLISPELRVKLGTRAAMKVNAAHSIQFVGSQIAKVIDAYL